MCQLAHLRHLQQHRGLRQIRDHDASLGRGDPLQLDMQLGRPLAFKLFAGQRQTLVRGFHVAQRGARQDHTETACDDSCDHRDVGNQRRKLDPVGSDPLQHVHARVSSRTEARLC